MYLLWQKKITFHFTRYKSSLSSDPFPLPPLILPLTAAIHQTATIAKIKNGAIQYARPTFPIKNAVIIDAATGKITRWAIPDAETPDAASDETSGIDDIVQEIWKKKSCFVTHALYRYTKRMASSLHEMHLQEIMVVEFIILDWIFALKNIINVIPCKRVSGLTVMTNNQNISGYQLQIRLLRSETLRLQFELCYWMPCM